MVLVDHDGVEADVLDGAVLDHPLLVEAAASCAVEVLVGEQHDGVAGMTRRMVVRREVLRCLLRVGRHRLLGEVRQQHLSYLDRCGLGAGEEFDR